jgi:hypothetical protein
MKPLVEHYVGHALRIGIPTRRLDTNVRFYAAGRPAREVAG